MTARPIDEERGYAKAVERFRLELRNDPRHRERSADAHGLAEMPPHSHEQLHFLVAESLPFVTATAIQSALSAVDRFDARHCEISDVVFLQHLIERCGACSLAPVDHPRLTDSKFDRQQFVWIEALC